MQGAYSTGDTNKVQYCQEVKSILARYKNPLCAAALSRHATSTHALERKSANASL